MSELSPQALAFLDEIREVCKRHGFSLAASGYDALQVWPLEGDGEPLHFNGIEFREADK